MIKLLTILMALTFSQSVLAEWTKVGESNKLYFYIDFSKIKKENQYISIWDLSDYKIPQTLNGKQFKSRIIKNVVDCNMSRNQTVAFYDYFEQMGKGEVVSSKSFSIRESDWDYPPPNSFRETAINIACERK